MTSISIAYYEPLLNSLRRFRETFPKVRLTIREMPSYAQAKALLSGEADVAFMRKLPMQTENIESRLILNEQIMMALPRHHGKAHEPVVDLRHFAEDEFVFTPQALGSGYHSQLTALCEAAGFYPKVVQEASQIHTLIGLVACGFGVALVPESIVCSAYRDKVQFRPILPLNDRPNPSVGLYMNWNSQSESLLRGRFISMLEFDDAQFGGESILALSDQDGCALHR